MNTIWDMIKKMMRVLCVTVFFPGVDVNFDTIDCYFGINGAKEKMEKMKTFFKEAIQEKPVRWQDWIFIQR